MAIIITTQVCVDFTVKKKHLHNYSWTWSSFSWMFNQQILIMIKVWILGGSSVAVCCSFIVQNDVLSISTLPFLWFYLQSKVCQKHLQSSGNFIIRLFRSSCVIPNPLTKVLDQWKNSCWMLGRKALATDELTTDVHGPINIYWYMKIVAM